MKRSGLALLERGTPGVDRLREALLQGHFGRRFNNQWGLARVVIASRTLLIGGRKKMTSGNNIKLRG